MYLREFGCDVNAKTYGWKKWICREKELKLVFSSTKRPTLSVLLNFKMMCTSDRSVSVQNRFKSFCFGSFRFVSVRTVSFQCLKRTENTVSVTKTKRNDFLKRMFHFVSRKIWYDLDSRYFYAIYALLVYIHNFSLLSNLIWE